MFINVIDSNLIIPPCFLQEIPLDLNNAFDTYARGDSHYFFSGKIIF